MRAAASLGPRLAALGSCFMVLAIAGVASAAFTTPELVIGQPLEAGPQASAVMASVWDGEAFMTVWSDDRSGQAGVYGARVAADGTLLNRPNLVFVTDQTNLDYPADAPALAFDGTNFLLAFRQNGYISVQRIDRTGKALDAKATRVSAGVGGVGRPTIAFDGTNYLVVMRERVGDTSWNEVRATRVSTAGVPLDKASLTVRFTLVKDAPLVGDPFARAAAGGTLIVWGEAPTAGNPSVLGTIIPPGAMPTQITTPISIATDAAAARGPVGVELDGTSFFVAWAEVAAGASTQTVRGRDVMTTATLGAPVTLLTGVSFNGGGVAADGQSWLLGSYELGTDKLLHATLARVDHAGALLDRVTLDDQGLMNVSAVPSLPTAVGGGHALAVWQAQVGPRHVPHAAPVPVPGGAKPAATRLAYALSRQSNPVMASNGQGYLVVWTEQRDTGFGLFGARVDAQLGVLDGTGIPIWSGAFGASAPAVASNGDGYLVAWAAGNAGVRARLVGADGKLGGAGELDVFDQPAVQPRVGVTGGVYLIAWQSSATALSLARVSAAGALLDATPLQIPTASYVSALRVTGSTGQFLLTWYDLGAQGTRAARINSTTGAILDASGVVLPPVGTEAIGGSSCVASSGDQYLLVWDRALGGIATARLSRDLTWLDTAPLALPHQQANNHIDLEDNPAVVWDGASYVLAWRDGVQTIYAGDPKLENLGFTRVSTQGALVNSGATVYSGTAGYLTQFLSDGPPLAAAADSVLVGETVQDHTNGYKVARNRAWLSSSADAGTCPAALCMQPVTGLPDASVPFDASAPNDASAPRDAGSPSDGGTSAGPDAAPPADAPLADVGAAPSDAFADASSAAPDGPVQPAADASAAHAPMHGGSGCSCSVSARSSSAPWSALLLLALLLRRRFRR